MSTELLPCPFCGCEAETWSDSRRVWGLLQHEDWCIFPNFRQHEISHEDFAAWNTRAERTCKNLEKRGSSLWFICSKCGAQAANGIYSEKWMHQDHTDEECAEYDGEPFNYCPNCGARVEEVDA